MPKTTSKTTTTTETFDSNGNVTSRVTETREETVESSNSPLPAQPYPTSPYTWPTVTSGTIINPDRCTCGNKTAGYCVKHSVIINAINAADPVVVANQVRAKVKQMGV